MQIEHKKNTAYYLAFPMVNSSSPESFISGETVSDTAYSKTGAGAWSSLAITDTVSEIASTGVYEIDLTAAELNYDQVIIKMTSTSGADTAFLFDMRDKLVDDLNDLSAADVNAECDTAISDASLATASALSTVDGNVDAILLDSNELQADWTNGGRLDLILDELTTNLDAVEADTQDIQTQIGIAGAGLTDLGGMSTAMQAEVNAECDTAISDASLATASSLATVDSNVDAVLLDTNELQTDWADGGRLDLIIDELTTNVDAIETDTQDIQNTLGSPAGASVSADIAALNDVSVSDVLTTQMTEAYAADGTAPTIAQALFQILSFLQERDVSGTTLTCKRLDGSTTSMTFTLNDGTSPTSITRAS